MSVWDLSSWTVVIKYSMPELFCTFNLTVTRAICTPGKKTLVTRKRECVRHQSHLWVSRQMMPQSRSFPTMTNLRRRLELSIMTKGIIWRNELVIYWEYIVSKSTTWYRQLTFISTPYIIIAIISLTFNVFVLQSQVFEKPLQEQTWRLYVFE